MKTIQPKINRIIKMQLKKLTKNKVLYNQLDSWQKETALDYCLAFNVKLPDWLKGE